MPELTQTDEFRFFRELTQVPRPSGHLDRIRAHLKAFADSRGLPYEEDEAGNALIRREGTTRTIVLQGHMDMVPTCSPGMNFDFVTHLLSVTVDGDWITAEGTTLGADDGAGLALILCALADPSLEGYSIEGLFTVDEEIGLLGAARLQEDWITGKMLVNLDNEDVNEIIIGSAGTADVEASFSFNRAVDNGDHYCVEVTGLRGGHSAIDIDGNRGNAILILAGFLKAFKGVRVSSFIGGTASNVIPMSAKAEFSVPQGTDVYSVFDEFAAEMRENFDEPDLTMSLKGARPSMSWTSSDTSSFLDCLLMCPNGVLERDVYGVKTSSNVGVVTCSMAVAAPCPADGDAVKSNVRDNVKVVVKPRSSDYEKLEEQVDTICAIFRGRRAEAERPEISAAWKESEENRIVKTAVSVYREFFGRDPVVTVTHGGLESSTIKSRNPGMEAVSVGPTIIGAHTPEERMDLATLTQMKGYVLELVRALSR